MKIKAITSILIKKQLSNVLFLFGFRLPLRMITKWDKSHPPEERMYEITQTEVADLDPKRSRLLCVLREGSNTLWNTFCLSGYIRPRKWN